MSTEPTDKWVPRPESSPPPLSDELELPELLVKSEAVRSLHAEIDREWGPLQRSACQTAAGRALWGHVVRDPVAGVLAGEGFLKDLYEKMKADLRGNAREVSGVILAVRTLWFDSRIEAAVGSFGGGEGAQVVLLGAGMDARAYRLPCLKETTVFEVDFPELLQTKSSLIQEAISAAADHHHQHPYMMAKSLVRVAADIRDEDWLDKLLGCGFIPDRNTVWVLEGITYYLPHLHATQVLRAIAASGSVALTQEPAQPQGRPSDGLIRHGLSRTVLLADFMNKASTALCGGSAFHFHSDWPERLLPTLGYSDDVRLSQIGDPGANFGLLRDPQSLFNRLRGVPRTMATHPEDGTPCRRLYLVEAFAFPTTAATTTT